MMAISQFLLWFVILKKPLNVCSCAEEQRTYSSGGEFRQQQTTNKP